MKPVKESRSSKRKSRSTDKKLKKISEERERIRDYDAEEKIGFDDNGEKSSSKSDNMDISP